jgi:hypothetical protein
MTSLFIALARGLGLRVGAAEVTLSEEARREGDLAHVVAVHTDGHDL